ncbi:odorant receptor 67c-like [Aphidius gifuensis]|uniref:Odorant receptor n=1 Tax=Aphidius gifuensis TaxID=684658 RepID=A0A3Q9EJH0_APHGI|nr:odorant receptor 67c-like [Aphidius gifuensis]AZQ24903.1 odorant receptor [Aphidius gifuensis]
MKNKNIKNQNLYDFNSYTIKLFNVLSFFRISPSNNTTFFKKACSTCFLIYFLTFGLSILTLEIIKFKDIDDLDSLSSIIPETCFTALGVFKWFYCILNIDKLKKVLKALETCHKLGYKINDKDKEYKIYHGIMLKAKKSSELFMILWYIFVVVGVSQWSTNPIIKDYYKNLYIHKNNDYNISLSRSYPVEIYLPIEVNSFKRYVMLYICNACAIVGAGIGMNSCDILCVFIMIFISAHLKYLNDCLIDIKDLKLIMSSNNPYDEFKKKLKNCIIYHQQILEVYRVYEDYSTRVLFVQCIENTVGLCLLSLRASTMKYSPSIDFWMPFTSLLEYSIGIAIELSVFCYFGTQLEELGLKVGDSFFSSYWERLPQLDTQKILLFGIINAQKPILITGGPFYILNLPTFKTLIYMSISNAVVLRQLAED